MSNHNGHLGGTYVAEQGLLNSLAKPRKRLEKVIPGKRSLAPQAAKTLDENGNEVPLDLKQFRVPKNEDRQRKVDEVIGEVYALHHKDLRLEVPKPASNYQKIKDNAESRRQRHAQAMKDYDERLKDISDELEEKVVAVGTAVREVMNVEIDGSIATMFAELHNREKLQEQSSHQYVVDMWGKINGLCAKRSAAVEEFKDRLEMIEQERGEIVGGELRKLADTMVATAYKLPQEIERLVEVEVYELNLVLIGNRRANADLIARMRKKDVKSFMVNRSTWLECEADWRTLRHNRATRAFQDLISSSIYTNPKQRQELFKQIKDKQVRGHSSRVELLQQLGSMRFPPALNSSAVTAVQKQFVELKEEEDELNADSFVNLKEQHQEMIERAKELRESLRAELHTYGALAPEGNLVEHSGSLDELLSDHSKENVIATPTGNAHIDDWFRMAGGLKPVLKDCMQTLRSPMLIYNDELVTNKTALTKKVELLCCALPLKDVLEDQGKTGERTDMMHTLEQLRKATKKELVGLLPFIKTKAAKMATVSGLPATLTAALEDIGNQFAKLEEEYHHDQHHYEKTLKKQSKGKKTDFAAELGVDVIHLNVAGVRAAQRKLGMLIYASDLPDAFKERLELIRRSLYKQRTANDIVDKVVLEESSGPLKSRAEEGKSLLGRVGTALSNQSESLHDGCSALCRYYGNVARMLEEHKERSDQIDGISADRLFDMCMEHRQRLGRDPGDEDDFEPDDPGLWEHQAQILKDLRHAEDEQALHNNLATALAQLADIEVEYRDYHKLAMSEANIHPVEVGKERRRYFRLFGDLFGLLVPKQIVSGFEDEIAPPVEDVTDADAEGEGDAGDAAADDAAIPAAADAGAEGEGDADAEEAAAAPVDPWEGLELIETPAGLLYGIDTPVDLLVKRIVPEPKALDYSEEAVDAAALAAKEAAEEEARMEAKSAAAQAILNGEVEDEDPKEKAKRRKKMSAEEIAAEEEAAAAKLQESEDVVAEVAAWKQAKAEAEEERLRIEAATYDPVPRDRDGNSCIEVLHVPLEMVAGFITHARGELVLRNEKFDKERMDAITDLCSTRRGSFTDELEERLRVHWPRKGRTDVKFYQPREGELNAHEQRHQRHVRATQKKNVVHEEAYQKLLVQARMHIEEYEVSQNMLQAQLPMQANLAALQGVEAKAKSARATFRMEAEDWRNRLLVLVDDEPMALQEANRKLLKSCLPFELGGDYNVKEIKLLEVLLDESTGKLHASTESRHGALEELSVEQEEAVRLGARFNKRYQQCMQELCMNDGLGQKYGAPRRNAQEKTRSEVARSEVAAAKIDELLATLQSLCDRAMDPELGEREAAEEKARMGRKAPKQPLSVRIRRCLIELRITGYRRAVYLNFLGESQAAALAAANGPDSCVLDVAVPADGETEFDRKDKGDPRDELLSKDTFEEVVAKVEEECLAATRELYAKEGKEDQLGPKGAPDALIRFLEEQRGRAEVQLEGAKRKLREQVGVLQEVLVKAPAAAMQDVIYRAQARTEAARAVVEKQAGGELGILETRKQENKLTLKPQLSDPNKKQELDDLCAAEEERTLSAQEVVSKTEQQLLAIEEKQASDFEARFVKLVMCMGVLLDTTLRITDLGWLPGDDEIIPKRKCLKRLKQQQRKNAAKSEQEEQEEGGAESEEPIVPRFPLRDWPGLAKFGGMTLAAALKLEEGGEEEEESAGGDDAAAAADGGGGDASSAEDATDGRLTTFVTTAHRQFVKARDSKYAYFQEYFFEDVAKLRKHYEKALEAEHAWARNWATMVDFLQRDDIEDDED